MREVMNIRLIRLLVEVFKQDLNSTLLTSRTHYFRSDREAQALPSQRVRLTLCWREPDSNHRFRLRYSSSGSSLVVYPDLSTLPSRKRSSQRTQRWREMDPNLRFRARSAFGPEVKSAMRK